MGMFSNILLGALGASIFWLYFPSFIGGVPHLFGGEMGKEVVGPKEAPGGQALGSRFQVVSDGKQVFLADLKEGRVWRYFRTNRDSREEEGFLSLSMFHDGKPYPSASGVSHGELAKGKEKP
jgi:hypothetical protein